MKDTYDMETEFHVLSALIRLSHKYQIEEIEARGIRALRAMYPTDLNSFMAVENHVNEESFVHAIGAINIARLTGTPSILPAAFYHCAVLREKVIKGLVREDGTKEYLSEQDLARCIRGIERLAAEFAAWCLSLSMNSLKPGQWGCKSEARCKDPGASIVAKMIRAITHRSITAEALSGFDFSGTKDMCSACVNRFEGEEQRAREKVWQRLPLTFNLAAELPWWPNEPDEAGTPSRYCMTSESSNNPLSLIFPRLPCLAWENSVTCRQCIQLNLHPSHL